MTDAKENLEGVHAKFENLCRELNMDRETEETSWNKFVEVSQRFSLEGDPILWFCCALYAACRESYTPTVGGSNSVVMGNCVSLNKLLRSCNMSIYEFISKIKNWQEMAKLSRGFISQIDRLERNFSITFHLFQRYNPIFDQLFQSPRNEKKNTKYRCDKIAHIYANGQRSASKCSSNKLYDMCWCLHLCAKYENPNYTMDLVTSFHLLICCIDLIYINVLADNRVDLINPDFEGVPDKWNTDEFDPSTITSHCIIEPLCRLTEALPLEAKTMKHNSWKNIIQEFFRTKTIYGDSKTFQGIVSNENFERNLKNLNSSYEQYVLSVGELDERILLNNPNYRRVNSTDGVDSSKLEHQQEINSLIPETPYTRKHFLPTKETFSEPVANATNNVKKLQAIAHISEPSELLRQAGDSVLKKIDEKLSQMSKIFFENFPDTAEASNRFELSKSLYFYLLDKIVRVEMKFKPNINPKVVLDADSVNVTLIACCVELVLEAYNTQLKFPWILNCFNINAYQFYKIIEIIVGRQDDILTRSLIKHLNLIEETCLESMAWQNSSPVWDIINSITKPLPTWSDVDVNNCSIKTDLQHTSAAYTPTSTICERVLTTTTTTTTASESARRDLFNIAKVKPQIDKTIDNSKKPEDGNRRIGSLPIFLRKFYKLAWLRMKELCSQLDMDNELFLKKIWTMFEFSITQKTELMQDRHLDQLLMCAIYLYIKAAEIKGKSFTDIMKFYRKQPQATSSTYREVLIEPADDKNEQTPKYGDIIFFYNNIYVPEMTAFSLNFTEKKKSQSDLLLSPHPTEKMTLPKKLTNNHLLYVYPLEKNEVMHSPNHLTYEFCKSPAKDLEKFNEIVRRGKRNLPFDDDTSVIGSKLTREVPSYISAINGIINDRQGERH